jgi:hypothetical protein
MTPAIAPSRARALVGRQPSAGEKLDDVLLAFGVSRR